MSTSDRESASALTPADFGQRAELLQSILDQSPLGVIAHRAVRDDSGEICDFKVVAYNRKALEVVGVPEPAFGHGVRLFELYPVQREYLDKLRRVVLEQVRPALPDQRGSRCCDTASWPARGAAPRRAALGTRSRRRQP